MTPKSLKIGSLLLDQQNPRIPPVTNQREALQQVIDDQQEKLANLADHIAEQGLNPIDLWFVERSVTQSDKWIVLEGNRRIAALKILDNPNVLSGLILSNSLQKRLEAAAKSFRKDTVEPVSCVETTREEANPWIQLRHTGADQGRGLVDWNGQASARFRGGDPALQALEFVRKHGNLSDAEHAVLGGRYITTLRRLLETPDVRSQLGLELKKKELLSSVSSDELLKGLRRIVLDLAEKKINVTALKTKAQMVGYVSGLDKKDKPDLTKSVPPQNLDQLMGAPISSPGTASGAPSPKQPRSIPTPPRLYVVPKPHVLKVTNQKSLEIYEELKSLLLAKHKHAISVLLRVFLELSVDHHLVSIGSKTTVVHNNRDVDKSLKLKVDECINDFIAKGSHKKEFTSILKALSTTTSALSPDTLHSYLHSRFSTPIESDLTATWDNAQPLFSRIWA
jgi:hypothetical protein